MASGTLGAADLIAATNMTVYTVPANTIATLNLSICNRSADVDTQVRVAVSTEAADPVPEDYIEYDAYLPASGVLERSAIVVGAGEKIIVRSSTSEVTARVHGLEEEA